MIKDALRLQFDMGLSLAEYGWSLATSRTIDHHSKQGNGARPVMLIPGFYAPENSLGHLARFLNRNGFDAHGWGLGTNIGPTADGFKVYIEDVAESLLPKVRELTNKHGCGVSLIGHSLGGVCARELALHLHPCIDRVITLGAPIFPLESLDDHNSILRWLGERQMKRGMEEVFVDIGTEHWPPYSPELPYIAIVSPIDAAVSEEYALIPQITVNSSDAPAIRENVRIVASHSGMGVNPNMLIAVADRLCADVNNWKTFDHSCLKPLGLLASSPR